MRRMLFRAGLCLLLAMAGAGFLWASGGGEATTAGTSKAAAGPLGKYDPPITITMVRAVDDTVKYPPGESLENNVWSRAYQDTLGIKIEYIWTVATNEQYNEKVNVAIASGDLPDFMGVNKTQLARLAKTDLVRKDLKALFDGNASPLLKSFVSQEGSAPMDAATFGGGLVGIPDTGSSIDGAPMMWIRVDWLKKLDLAVPKTYDELLKVIDAFVTKDPNGTGKNDYVGLAINKNLIDGYSGYEGFANMFGAYPRTWVEKNGRLVFGSYQPEMRTALLELQKLYAAGRLDREFAVKDGGKVSELAVAGRNGLHFGAMWNSLWPLQANRDLDPKADWMAYPLPTATGKPARPQISLGTSAWNVVNAKAKYPEALIKMVNLFVESAWGEKGEYGKYMVSNVEGTFYEVFKFSAFRAWPAFKNLDIYRIITAKNTAGMNPEQVDMNNRNEAFKKGNDKEWGYARVFGEEGSFRTMDGYVKSNVFQMNAFYGADTATQAAKGSSLEKLETETFTKIILGAPIAEFDAFVESVMKLGAKEIENEVNEWYAQTKK